jgi:hypothetical protein
MVTWPFHFIKKTILNERIFIMRLYGWNRNKITNRFIEYTFGVREKVLNETRNTLGMEVYNSMYDTATRVKMQALPDGWLPEQDYLYVNARGYVLNLQLGKKVRVFARNISSGRTNLTDDAMITRLQNHAMEEERVREERSAFAGKMRSFLANINTDKKLFEAMPEAKDILGENFFGVPDTPCTALVTTANEILCVVAKNREEEREGCCNGKLVTKE